MQIKGSLAVAPEKRGCTAKGREVDMCKVLLFDKDEVIRMLYRETLEEEGFSVVDTGKHEIFCQMIEEESPDIVVMGADHNQWRSLHLLQTIRWRYSDLPVILCTTYCHVKQDSKALAADHILVKGSDTGELLKSRIRMIQNAMAPMMEPGHPATNGPWKQGDQEPHWYGSYHNHPCHA